MVRLVRVVPEIDIFASSLFAILSSDVNTWRLPAASSFNGHGLLEEGPVTNNNITLGHRTS